MSISYEKNDYIDIVKGVAIFCVLWGHCIQYCSVEAFDFFENWMFKIIYSFHMPLFMMISGYLFCYSLQKRTLIDVLKHRTRSILQPIVMCGLLKYILVNLLVKVFKEGIKPVFIFLKNGTGLSSFGCFWFLWSTLACCVSVAIIWKVFYHTRWRAFALIFGFLMLCLFPETEYSIFLYPYFVVGFVYHEYSSYFKNKFKWIKPVVLVTYPVLLLFFKKEHYIYTTGLYSSLGVIGSLKIDLFRWIIGLFGCLFVLIVLQWIYSKTSINKEKKMSNLIANLGKKSLQIYCLQSIFLEGWLAKVYRLLVNRIGINPLAFNHVLYNLVFTPLIALGMAVMMLYLIKWLEKIRVANYIFGR